MKIENIELSIKLKTDIERLVFFIRSINLNFKDFENKIGVSKGYIEYQQQQSVNIESKLLVRLSNVYPNLNIMWIITGRNSMTLESNENLLALA